MRWKYKGWILNGTVSAVVFDLMDVLFFLNMNCKWHAWRYVTVRPGGVVGDCRVYCRRVSQKDCFAALHSHTHERCPSATSGSGGRGGHIWFHLGYALFFIYFYKNVYVRDLACICRVCIFFSALTYFPLYRTYNKQLVRQQYITESIVFVPPLCTQPWRPTLTPDCWRPTNRKRQLLFMFSSHPPWLSTSVNK